MLTVACAPLIDVGQSAKAGYGGLGLAIQTDRSRGGVGEPVHIRFTVTNSSNQIKILDSKDTPVLDAVVMELPSRQVLLSWAALHPDQDTYHLELSPGESKVLEMVWTPTQEEYNQGMKVFIAGLLSINSQVVQSATAYYCYGGCER